VRDYRAVAEHFTPLLIYTVIATVLFGKATSWTEEYFGGGDSDAFLFIWFLNWWPFALAHHLDPLVTTFQWYPHAYNLSWDTLVPFPALIGWPLTAAGGAALTFNVLTLTSPVLAAWTGFLLARSITRDWAASIIGGYFFGFSSYELGQMIGHLNLDMIWLVPVAVLLGVARVRRTLSRLRYVLGLAAVLVGEFGISTEIFASLIFFAAALWAVCFVVADAEIRPALVEAAIETLGTIFIVALAVSPFLFFMRQGMGELPAELNSVEANSADLLNFFVPTAMTWLAPADVSSIASRFSGNVVEQGAYLGLPIIGMIIFYVATAIRRKIALVLAVMMVILVVSSLGPVLRVGGISTHILLPWNLIMRLPLISAALPTRFTMYVALCASVMVSLWLAIPRWRVTKFCAALLGCVALVPNVDNYPWLPLPDLAFFQGGHERSMLGPDAKVLILPFGGNGPGSYWQVAAKLQFRQAGGYLGYVPRSEAGMQVVDDLVNGRPDPDFGREFAAYCESHGVQYVLIGPGAEATLAAAVMAEGWKAHTDSGVTVVAVPFIRAG
jgi:hypothetical protein